MYKKLRTHPISLLNIYTRINVEPKVESEISGVTNISSVWFTEDVFVFDSDIQKESFTLSMEV